MNHNRSDEELIHLVAQGDTTAFDELYRRYHQAMYRYLTKMVFDKEMIDELFQDIFTKVYTKAYQFKEKISFKSWIYKIALNHFKDYYAKTKRNQEIAQDSQILDTRKDLTQDLERSYIEHEEIQMLQDAMNTLSEALRQAIVLKKIENLTFEEIAEIMEVSSRSVKNYVSQAMIAIQDYFDRKKT